MKNIAFACITLIALTAILIQCKNANNKIVFSYSNEYLKKEFIASDNQPNSIETFIYSQHESHQLNNDKLPYFIFFTNHQRVSATDKIWRFVNTDERKMKNGGTEFIINFEVAAGKLAGLQLAIYQQFFPHSALVREKLVLSAKDGQQFTLNKEEERILFDFPCYQLKTCPDSPLVNHEIRIGSWELKPTTFGETPKGNHMFYPNIIESNLTDTASSHKGPVSITSDGAISWFTAYEHASQDNTNGLFDESKKTGGKYIVDAMQGTKGVFNFEVNDSDFWFLKIENQKHTESFDVKIKSGRGAYYDGEIIDSEHPYSSVWTASAFYTGNNLEQGKQILRHYLLNQICENLSTRKPEFYYNTWGLQRNDPNKPLRGILTYKRIFEEIDHARELGVDIFVLDDGWEQAQGDWTPNKERLPEGLAPVKKKLDEYGMKMGLWFSPMGIDSTTQRYKDHPEWVIRDSEGNPIQAQWGHPAFDFVGGFYDVFVDDCKKLIDQGCRYMKWDAINTFYSTLPNLDHGDASLSEEERRARYEYLLPIYVTRAMEELTSYEPDLVIEIDLTEARRVMVGFAPLSQGKLFWMNNGASGYNDYTTYRAKSMRTIANEFAGIIPWELLTYANYPHNQNGALVYNTTNSILAGNGFWGNLALMTSAERQKIGKMITSAKGVLPHLYGVNPQVIGKVGDSPEIYTILNDSIGAGQIIGFSEQAMQYPYKTKATQKNVLAVTNTTYQFVGDSLLIEMKFPLSDSSFLAYILPNQNIPASIISATASISKADLSENVLSYESQTIGKQTVVWDISLGKPEVSSSNEVKSEYGLTDNNQAYIIQIETTVDGQNIKINGAN